MPEVTSSKKTYIILAHSRKTGKSIYHENAETKYNAIERGLELSAKNDLFYYLIFESSQTVIYDDSLFKENNALIPIQKSTNSKLIAECCSGVVRLTKEEEMRIKNDYSL